MHTLRRLLVRGLTQVVLIVSVGVILYGLLTSDSLFGLGALRLTP